MLKEYRKIYKDRAILYDGWQTKGKSELVKEYLETNNDYCLCAIFYRFWSLPTNAYYSQKKKIATENDCYNWLVNSIMYTLSHKAWEDKNTSIYEDPLGPEKSIIINFNSEKINFFVSCKRQKRILNYNSLSLDELEENSSDSYFSRAKEKNVVSKSFYKDKISSLFNNKEYLASFILDSIINFNFIISFNENGIRKVKFDYSRLKKHLRRLNEEYCNFFSNYYDIDNKEVEQAIKFVSNLSYSKMERDMKNIFLGMSKDKELLDILC